MNHVSKITILWTPQQKIDYLETEWHEQHDMCQKRHFFESRNIFYYPQSLNHGV